MGVSSALAGAVNAVPLGTVSGFAGSTAPSGWQLCYGQAISRTQYAGLFAVTSTTYGSGDGSTTFNVPDLRGRVVAGLDNMGGTDAARLSTANTLGTTTGTETITLTSAEMPSHTHTQNAHSHTVTDPYADIGEPNWVRYGGNGPLYDISGSTRNLSVSSETATNQNTGSGGSHNNMQPTMTINYIIKAQ